MMLMFAIASEAFARLPPMPDGNDAVFTATHVVIVSPGKPHAFIVQRSYLGDLAVGSAIELPTFRLVTWNDMGLEQPQSLTDSTHILLFLRRDGNSHGVLAIIDYGNAFFFRDLARIDELDAMATRAIDYHRRWQVARDTFDRQGRIRALFPYLLNPAESCHHLTLTELAKLNPDSGDYLAEILPRVSPNECQSLLLDIRQLQSPRSHSAAIAMVDRARAQLSNYLDAHHLKNFDITAQWNHGAPEELKGVSGIMYYGLAAIRSFGDQADMPYFRGLIPFLLSNGLEQSVEECGYAMRQNPGPENIPVLKAIWEDYKSHHYTREQETLLPIDLARTLTAQNDIAVIAILLELLDNYNGRDSAHEGLRKLSGKDFHTDAEWRSWYESLSKGVEKTVQ